MARTLFWYSPHREQWVPTTAPTTDQAASTVRRMGYAVRVQEALPTGKPNEVDLELVRKAGG